MHRRDFDKTKCLFLIKNEKLLEKYNEIWDKVFNDMNKGFDSERVYKERYIKTKIKPYEGKIAIFHGDKYHKMVLNAFVCQ